MRVYNCLVEEISRGASLFLSFLGELAGSFHMAKSPAASVSFPSNYLYSPSNPSLLPFTSAPLEDSLVTSCIDFSLHPSVDG